MFKMTCFYPPGLDLTRPDPTLPFTMFMSRDGNLYPTREYPAQLDPNGAEFTRPDKE